MQIHLRTTNPVERAISASVSPNAVPVFVALHSAPTVATISTSEDMSTMVQGWV